MNTLEYILQKIDTNFEDKSPMPIEIPNVGRQTLASWLHELDFKTGVEVGVAAGDYSAVICQANPQMKLYGIDPYQPLAGYRDYTKPHTFQKFREAAEAKLTHFSNYQFIHKTSMEAANDFADDSLDFVYIDANHAEPFITEDITEWSKKIRLGGILAGHDYARPRSHDDMSPHHDVKSAVQGYTAKHHIKPWFVLGSWTFKKNEIRDNPRSWLWVKQ